MMSINLGINFLSIRPIRCSIVQYWIDSQRASSTTTNSGDSHLGKVIVKTNRSTTMIWLSRILLVCHRTISIKLHQCRSILSLTILAQPHFTFFVILYLHATIVHYISAEYVTTWFCSPLFSLTQIVFATIEMFRGYCRNGFLTTREHQEFEVFTRTLDIKTEVRTCNKLICILGKETIDTAIGMCTISLLGSHISILIIYRHHLGPTDRCSCLPILRIWTTEHQWICFPKNMSVRAHRSNKDTSVIRYANTVWRVGTLACSIEVLTILLHSTAVVTITHFFALVWHLAWRAICVEQIQSRTIRITDVVGIVRILQGIRSSFYTEHSTKVFIHRVVVDIHRCWTEHLNRVIHKSDILKACTLNVHTPSKRSFFREVSSRNLY